MAWKKIFVEKYEKIDEKETWFNEMDDHIGTEAASVIKLILDQDATDTKSNKAKL
jgi:hypothetical protein